MSTTNNAPAADGTAGTTAAATQPTAQEIRAAEQARCGAILNAPEAKGREQMAQHLAFSTDMSADQAKALLAVAPAAAATPAVATPAADAANPLAAAMAGAGVVVPPDAAANTEMSLADQALAAYGAASGRTFAPVTQTKQ